MRLFATLLPIALIVGCASPQPVVYEPRQRPVYAPAPKQTPRIERRVEAAPVEQIKPNNWFVERKILHDNEYVISRSMESEKYMWLTCKIEPTGITGLSLGMVQPNDIGNRNDETTMTFEVHGFPPVTSPGIMVNSTHAGIRSFSITGDRDNDLARIAQGRIIERMRFGRSVTGEARLPGIGRKITVDLTGFSYAADQVLEACDKMPDAYL